METTSLSERQWYLVVREEVSGGGRSLSQTGLCGIFPVNREFTGKIGEIRSISADLTRNTYSIIVA